MGPLFSSELEKILAYARDEAMRTGSAAIGPDHLALGILRHSDNNACRVLEALGINLEYLKRCIEAPVFHEHAIPYCEMENVRLSKAGQSAVAMALAEAAGKGAEEACAEHLLLALEGMDSGSLKAFLSSNGITRASITGRLSGKAKGPAASRVPEKNVRKFTFVFKQGDGGGLPS